MYFFVFATYVFYCFFIWNCLSIAINDITVILTKIKANNTLLEPKLEF